MDTSGQPVLIEEPSMIDEIFGQGESRDETINESIINQNASLHGASNSANLNLLQEVPQNRKVVVQT